MATTEQHQYVYHFTRVEKGKSSDVFRCPVCGVVGYRPSNSPGSRPIARDKKRWASEQYATCEGKLKADARKARQVSE